MNTRSVAISRLVRRLMVCLTILLCNGLPFWVAAHPMPNSVVLLDIQSNGVSASIQLPLSELELAFGYHANQNPETLVNRLGPELRAYIQKHVRPVGLDGRVWRVDVGALRVQSSEQPLTGIYHELTAHLWLQPPAGANPRQFKLHYDVIVHQLVTHTALVSIRQDWETGRYGEQLVNVGIIQIDVPSNTILPLNIDQTGGGLWQGFRGMVALGMQHIAEGTDHLLFLLVLLLPAPLRVAAKRWGRFGGLRYSLIRLLKIVTAFTLGHSLTLLAGALGWLRLPAQPVEILIAFSILVSAIHAWRPVFAGRETYVAAGFGLVHGLAFADTLTNLNLDTARMALSILGFNIGIELMQFFVIALIIPWLILLSRTSAYSWLRIVGAVFAGIAALAWMTERIVGKPNSLTILVERLFPYTIWLVLPLAVTSVLFFWWEQRRNGAHLI